MKYVDLALETVFISFCNVRVLNWVYMKSYVILKVIFLQSPETDEKPKKRKKHTTYLQMLVVFFQFLFNFQHFPSNDDVTVSLQKEKPAVRPHSEDEDEEEDSDGGDTMMVRLFCPKALLSPSLLCVSVLTSLSLAVTLKSAEDVIAQQAKQQEDDPYANLSKKEKKKKKKQVIIVCCYCVLIICTSSLL